MTSGIFVATRDIKMGIARRPAGVIVAIEGTSYPGFPNQPKPILNNGTGSWAGFASGIVGGVCNCQDGLFDSYCVGYSAPTLPMWPGVLEAREKAVAFLLFYCPLYKALFGVYPPNVFAGYSQGSMAVDVIIIYDILTPPGGKDPWGTPTGRLHYLAPFLYRAYQLGHIFRTPGVAWGNSLIGQPQSIKVSGVESGGIGTAMDITNEQVALLAPDGKPIWHSCALHGDIYTCNACGLNPWTNCAPEGIIGNDFEKVVMQPTMKDILGLSGVLLHPIAGILELFQVMGFFAQGPDAPHYQYYPHMVGCIEDCYQLGLSLPHTP